MLARNCALTAAFLLAACSNGELPPPFRPGAAATPAHREIALPATSSEIGEALKERLAREGAAIRMYESMVLHPAPPKVPAAARAAPKKVAARAPNAPVAEQRPPLPAQAELPGADPAAAATGVEVERDVASGR